ncbi:MAG: Ig-like domain-containing protein [Erysipelotrichaceae bacterium]|nr:Ig-like domain-containing protein [Erysipelotrichaceae bacterium]
MNKKIFSLALCGALFLQSTTVLHAEDSFETDEWIPEDQILTEAGTIDNDYISHPNDMGADDEGSDAQGINVEYHSIEKIREYYNNNPVSFLDSVYDTQPTTTAPYAAGSLTDTSLNDALKTVNLIRYLAGLNHDVTLDDTYINRMQAGSLINAVNNSLSSSPTKPNGMDQALYQLGLAGNSNANLAFGYSSLGKAITEYWLNDGDSGIISSVKNRKQLLNATMAKTGFGQVGSYSGMYVTDTSGTSARTSNVWPAQNTPVEFFGSDYPWTVSTGNTETFNSVVVSMENTKTGASYIFSAAESDGYFNVDNSAGYGDRGTIIWRPAGLTYADGDSYMINISGLSGDDIFYRVNFFTLDISQEQVVINPSSLKLEVGEKKQVTVQFTPSTISDSVAFISCPGGYAKCTKAATNKYNLTGVKPGKFNFKVKTANDIIASCSVTVKGVRITPETLELAKGDTYQFTAQIFPADDSQTFTWTSSDPSIAAVTQSGRVTAGKSGTATITASAGGYTASATVTVKAIDLKAVNLTLTGNIGVNFSFDIPEEERSDTYISFTLNNSTERFNAADAEADDNGWLRFTALAAAKEMRDTITVRVENEEGELKSFESGGQTIEGTFTYTVENYFKSARKNYSGNTKLINLVNAMDTYSKYAQINFGYNTEGMEAPDALGTVALADLEQFKSTGTGSVTGITVSNISLSLESDTGVKAYFTVAAGHNINEYVIKADNEAVELVNAGSANTYYAQLRGAAAKDLDEAIHITITNHDETETQSITYYPLSYVRSIIKNSASYETELVNVCKALYFYWVNAEAYFSN